MNSDSTFQKLGLSAPLLKAIEDNGYKIPTPIQTKVIPIILNGADLMAAAQTGTGKTAGFTLPILHRLTEGKSKPTRASNQTSVLILAPTRELAVQIEANIRSYAQYLSIRTGVVYGGVKINPQMMMLRKGVDILVATPGRLIDLYNQNAIKFNQLSVLVLDEADRMLNLGFTEEIQTILNCLPERRQNLFFSATFSNEIRQLAKNIVHNPVEITVNPQNTTATTVKQWMVPVDKKRKPALLVELMQQNKWQQTLVFCKTKKGVNQLTTYLQEKGFKPAAIHGDKSQAVRTKALTDFKNEVVNILVATDVAARGLDIIDLPHVINFDLPKVAEDYVHRIGRTGRAGMKGEAVSFVAADEIELLINIEHLINKLLPRTLIDGFEPRHDVPISTLGRKAKKPKKPKKPKIKTENSATNKSNNKTAQLNKRTSRNKIRSSKKNKS